MMSWAWRERAGVALVLGLSRRWPRVGLFRLGLGFFGPRLGLLSCIVVVVVLAE
jgi:hypothetical protein